ncbi:MAG: hypothetical protein WCV87_03775 [Candidatus Paceibacterota bacterium]|jgi:hypothetical protein
MQKKLLDILITAGVAALLAFLQGLLTGLTQIDPVATGTIAGALKMSIPSLG